MHLQTTKSVLELTHTLSACLFQATKSLHEQNLSVENGNRYKTNKRNSSFILHFFFALKVHFPPADDDAFAICFSPLSNWMKNRKNKLVHPFGLWIVICSVSKTTLKYKY